MLNALGIAVFAVIVVGWFVFAIFRFGWIYPRVGRWMAMRVMPLSPRVANWLLPDERAEEIERDGG